jgi:hypothetical protein
MFVTVPAHEIQKNVTFEIKMPYESKKLVKILLENVYTFAATTALMNFSAFFVISL